MYKEGEEARVSLQHAPRARICTPQHASPGGESREAPPSGLFLLPLAVWGDDGGWGWELSIEERTSSKESRYSCSSFLSKGLPWHLVCGRNLEPVDRLWLDNAAAEPFPQALKVFV